MLQSSSALKRLRTLIERGLFELKTPRYFAKAKTFFQPFIKGKDFKIRHIPLSVIDEKILLKILTDDEIKQAKNLSYLQAVGILSYSASNCKLEIRYAISADLDGLKSSFTSPSSYSSMLCNCGNWPNSFKEIISAWI